MKLYHGSTMAVRQPSLTFGRSNADFGKGFYTTTQFEQAERWAKIKQKREGSERAVVSVYDFDESLLQDKEIKTRRFLGVDEAWFHFVTDCRKSRQHGYDLVEGPVANDNVFTTVNLFESGILSAEAAILQLKAYKTYDQLSFHSEKTIGTLQFVEAKSV